MKRMIKTLSIALIAAACMLPGLAWAAGNVSASLERSGELKITDASQVHSVLVEVVFSGDEADKVTDVFLKDAPANALASTSYAPESKKATIALSSGSVPLQLEGSSLGTIGVVAQDASGEHPVPVDARLTAMQYIDQADSSSDTEDGTVDPNAVVRLSSTESQLPPDDEDQGDPGSGNGGASNGSGIGDSSSNTAGNSGSGNGAGTAGGNGSTTGGSTGTADYRAQGVVGSTQTGQSTADNASLVRTGDVALICGIVIAAAAACVFIAMAVTRRKERAK